MSPRAARASRAHGPGRRGSAGPGRTSRRRTSPLAAASTTGRPPRRRRSRFTGRAAILVLVLAVLVVSSASSLRAYLQQRAHLEDLDAQIAQRTASINALDAQRKRWDDPAYVEQQARARFGYVRPGERSYTVLGSDGTPIQGEAALSDPSSVAQTPTPWWSTAWQSVEVAGDPPRPTGKPPATEIDGTQDDQQGSGG